MTGLATIKQARLLVRCGIPPAQAKRMPFAAAAQALGDLSNRGWRPDSSWLAEHAGIATASPPSLNTSRGTETTCAS